MMEGWKFQNMCHHPPAADREGGCAPSSPTRRSGCRTMPASSAASRTFPTNRLTMSPLPDFFYIVDMISCFQTSCFWPSVVGPSCRWVAWSPSSSGRAQSRHLEGSQSSRAGSRWNKTMGHGGITEQDHHVKFILCEMDNPKLLEHQILFQ